VDARRTRRARLTVIEAHPHHRLSRVARLTLLCAGGTMAVGLASTIAALAGWIPSAPPLGPATVSAALLVAAATIANLGLRFLRWQFLLRRARVRLATMPALAAFVGSFTFVPVPLYLGQLYSRAWLLPLPPRERGAVLLAFVWEQATNVVALLLLTLPVLGGAARAVACAGLLLLLVPRVRRGLARAALALASAAAQLVDAEVPDETTAMRFVDGDVLAPALAASLAAWTPVALAILPVVWAIDGASGLAVVGAAAGSILGGAVSLVPLGAGTAGFLLIHTLEGLGIAAAPAVAFVFRAATAWLTLGLGALALGLLPSVRRRAAAHDHFDAIDACYDAWLPAHYREHLVARKTAPIIEELATLPAGARGLDIGCGRGWYFATLAQAGAQMTGVDTSGRQLVAAAEHLGGRPRLTQASVLALPFRSASFDFAYIINVLHHVAPPAAQQAALAEIARVVRPGGRVFVHEMNVRNPLFRFYLGYVFPILKGIEEGTEYYLDPRSMDATPGLRLRAVRYFTFVPDFVPARLLGLLAQLERRLERSGLAPYAAHFVTVHERT